MPLQHDPEYQSELDKIKRQTYASARIDTRIAVAVTAVVMFGLCFGLRELGVTNEAINQTLVATGLVILIWQIGVLREIIHVTTALSVGTVEWTGRKALGEYSPPTHQ